MTDVGGVPTVVSGGTGDSWGGMLGILLVVALLGGGGLWGGREGGMSNEMLNTNIGQGFSNVSNRMDYDGIRDGQFGIQRDILAQTTQLDRSIMEVGFGNERNAAAIIHNQDHNTQRIIDWLASNELREANAMLAEKDRLLSEARITATVIGSLQPPRPVPSYQVANPYTGFGGYGPGFGFGA